ncbi:hypothetical protein Tco_0409832 [Tanacetum coccineum]
MENLYLKHELLRDLNAEESWALLEDLALYDNESWNDPRDFAKPVKATALPQDVPSTSDRRLIELENQYCMEDPEQAFVEYASSRTDEAGEGMVSEFMASQDARLSKFEADFKRQQDPQCSTQTHGSINAITIHTEQQNASYDDGEKENKEEEDNLENIHVNPPTPPDSSVAFITEKVLKFNSFFESLGLVPS